MLNEMRAYFFLLEGEQMPEDAPDEWFLQPDPAPRTEEQVQIFVDTSRHLADALADVELDELAIQTIFYDHAKLAFGEEKSSIREYFKMLYLLIFHRDSGPRWGQFVMMLGRDEFIERLERRLDAPMVYPIA